MHVLFHTSYLSLGYSCGNHEHILAKDLNQAVEIVKVKPIFEDTEGRIEVRPINKVSINFKNLTTMDEEKKSNKPMYGGKCAFAVSVGKTNVKDLWINSILCVRKCPGLRYITK